MVAWQRGVCSCGEGHGVGRGVEGRCGGVSEGRLGQLSGRAKSQRLSMSEVNRL